MQDDGQKKSGTKQPEKTKFLAFYVEGEIPRHTLFVKPSRPKDDPNRINLEVVEKNQKWMEQFHENYRKKYGDEKIKGNVRVVVLVQTKKDRQTSHMAWTTLQAIEGIVEGEVLVYRLLRVRLPAQADSVFTKINIECL